MSNDIRKEAKKDVHRGHELHNKFLRRVLKFQDQGYEIEFTPKQPHRKNR